jgi:hypothetical protein
VHERAADAQVAVAVDNGDDELRRPRDVRRRALRDDLVRRRRSMPSTPAAPGESKEQQDP